MAITVKNLLSPEVLAYGNRVYAAGHTHEFTGELANQATPGGTPTSVTNTEPYVFSKWVYMAMFVRTEDEDVGVDLRDYPTNIPTGLKSIIGMLPENEQGAGNILFTFGPGRTLSPTESEMMRPSGLLILRPGESPPAEFVDDGYIPYLTIHQFADDVIEINSAVFAQGRVGDRSVVRIRIV